jgi:hypothetical protein
MAGRLGRRQVVAGGAVLLLGAGPASAEERLGPLSTPARGSAERRAIMDAARVPIGAEIGRPVIFVVDILNSDGRWAYLQAVPVNPDGSAIDWQRTPFAADMQDGFMSDIAMVLLRHEGGGWRAVEWVMGPTDVFWITWAQRYGLAERLFTR